MTASRNAEPAVRTSFRSRLRDWLDRSLDFAAHYLARAVPTEWASGLGARLGRRHGLHRFHDERERAVRLYLLGRQVSVAEAEVAVMRLFTNVGRTMLEFSHLDRLWDEGRIAVTGAEHLLAARAGGRPVIVMGLHLNNWEVIAPALSGLGLAGFNFIYQPPKSGFERRIAVRARERCGAILLPPGVKAARIARRLLVEQKGVLLIFAEDERDGRVNAPLFGRPIPPRANLTATARLAAASRAAVIPAYAERDGARHRVIFLPAVELAPETGADAARENVHRLDQIITPLVQDRLDQWYMLLEHRRH